MFDHVGSGPRVVHRDPGPPFEIGGERRPEVGIVGQPDQVGGGDHPADPAQTLLLGQSQATVTSHHVRGAAVLGGVSVRAAECLSNDGRQAAGGVSVTAGVSGSGLVGRL